MKKDSKNILDSQEISLASETILPSLPGALDLNVLGKIPPKYNFKQRAILYVY